MKIIVLSPSADILLTPELMKKLKQVGEVVLVNKPQPFDGVDELKIKDDKILALDPDFSNWNVPNSVIEKITNLKAICLQSTSFSWVDVDQAKKLGIPVLNIKGFSTEAVAEMALLMAVNVARKLPLIIKDDWKQDFVKYQGVELKGKVAGVIGVGRIGTRILELCQAYDMRVVYWSRKSRDDRFFYLPLRTLLKRADYIISAIPENKRTKSLITNKMYTTLKPTAILVSLLRTCIYNHTFALRMVKQGKLYGYAFEQDGGGPIDRYEGNVLAVPALAWVTDGSLKRIAEGWVENIVKAARGNFENRVN